MGRGLDGISIPIHWHCVVLKAREGPVSHRFPVAMARGKHLFPFRTEPLSPSAPMVLGLKGPGRVGRRRFNFSLEPSVQGWAGGSKLFLGRRAVGLRAGWSGTRYRGARYRAWELATGRRGPTGPRPALRPDRSPPGSLEQ
jgi:hypothetical protein